MPIAFEKPVALLVWLLIPVVWKMMGPSIGGKSARRKKRLIGGIRALLIFLLGLMLSHPTIRSATDQVNLFFCLDISESIGNDEKTAAKTFIREAAVGMEKNDRAGLIVFGKNPYLEMPMSSAFGTVRTESAVNTHLTNIYGALAFAVGKFPQTGTHKIILFTDGNQNLQHAEEAAHLARSLDISIHPVPMDSGSEREEVVVRKLETPEVMPLQTPFDIRLVLENALNSRGRLLIFRNDRLFVDRMLTTEAGKSLFAFPDMLAEPGLYRYKAVINFPEDGFYQNNEGIAFTRGTRKSQILYLSEADGPESPLIRALNRQGLELVRKGADHLSLTIDTLIEYDAVILDNVSGNALSYQTMAALETYVRDFGGGLVVVGGDRSFGPGHYRKTPLEKALPVSMAPPTRAQFSRLCLIFIIDKSASMSASYSGKSKLEMAKIAAFSSVEMLNPLDRVGILAFDAEAKWIVPITSAQNRKEIAGRLSRVKEGGGTILYPALEEASNVLRHVEAVRKHVIVLSDGETDPADFKSLVESMRRSGISVSTVCIGAHSDRALMQSIADWGNGRGYVTEDPRNIPKIFTGETKIVARTAIIEKPLKPGMRAPVDMMQGIGNDLPVLYGQVITYPKPGARIIIETPEGPLLAVWRYGLGRSVVFTSDLSHRWGKAWANWADYGKFSSQMVKWAKRPEIGRNLAAVIHREGESGTLTVDAISPQQRFLNHLRLKANVKLPSQESRLLTLEQVAPGKYRSTFPAEEVGTYYFSLFEEDQGAENRPQVFGYGIPYTDEFDRMGVDHTLLAELASITGGKVLDLRKPPHDLFAAETQNRASGNPLWPVLAGAFLLFLLIDVAARKIFP